MIIPLNAVLSVCFKQFKYIKLQKCNVKWSSVVERKAKLSFSITTTAHTLSLNHHRSCSAGPVSYAQAFRRSCRALRLTSW